MTALASHPRTRRALMAAALVAALMAVGLAWGEWRGWPWLAQPLAGWLTEQLGRDVRFEAGLEPGPEPAPAGAPLPAPAKPATPASQIQPDTPALTARLGASAAQAPFRLALLGRVRLQVAQLHLGQRPGLGAPPGAPMLLARQAEVVWRYSDLWALARARSRGGAAPPLVLQALSASDIQLHLLRSADGRASWQFGSDTVQPATPGRTAALDGVRIRSLRLPSGGLRLEDTPQALDLRLAFAVAAAGDGLVQPATPASATAPAGWSDAALAASGLRAEGQGRWHGQPLRLSLRTGALGPWLGGPANAPDDPAAPAPAAPAALAAPGAAPDTVPVQLRLQAGRAQGQFTGRVAQPLNGLRLAGDYQLSGPSLAAVGEPLGLVLPSTADFAVRGRLQQADGVWNTVLQDLRVGRSRITGALQYQSERQPRPLLAGRLQASALWLADLAPTVGGPAAGPGPRPPTPGVAAAPRAMRGAAPNPGPQRPAAGAAATSGRVLPDRTLDLPVLRTMDAEVAVAADRLEAGTDAVQDALSLAGHLSLNDGLLALRRLDARLAGGRLRGDALLDARVRPARWQARLRLRQVDLAQWVRQPRSQPGAPPYLAGRLAANLDLSGRGNSTAQWLASADGTALLHLRQGQVSHLALELAGLDLAQALGVALSGDRALPVACAVADLVLQQGVVRPRVAVLDTNDSTVWLEGQASLADERLQLLARVAPKDRSLLALRSPVRIGGSFAAPSVSVEAVPLLRRLGLAGALGALVNPAAALLPLLELGDDESEQARAACARARRPADGTRP